MCLALLLHSGCALDRIIYKTFSIHYTKEMKYNERPRTPYPEGNCFLQLCFLKKEYHQTHLFFRNLEPSSWAHTSTIRTI